MASEPWKSNDWFVSEWNYAPDVTKDFKFAKDIKIRIAEALAEAGVHRIEAGMPVVSPSDNEAIQEIVKRNLGPQIFSFARCMKDDVQRAVDTGVNGVVMEIRMIGHGLSDRRYNVVDQLGDIALQGFAVALQPMGDGGHRPALGMSQHDEHRRVDMGQSIFDGPDFVGIADVARHANGEDIHQPGVENQFHRNPRIRAGDDRRNGMVGLILGSGLPASGRTGVRICRLSGIKAFVSLHQ